MWYIKNNDMFLSQDGKFYGFIMVGMGKCDTVMYKTQGNMKRRLQTIRKKYPNAYGIPVSAVSNDEIHLLTIN